jgi:hypothetical protein
MSRVQLDFNHKVVAAAGLLTHGLQTPDSHWLTPLQGLDLEQDYKI